MRTGLSQILHTKPAQLQFTRGEKGKPLLISSGADKRSVGFNVSHQVSQCLPCFVCWGILLCRHPTLQGDYTVFAAHTDTEGKITQLVFCWLVLCLCSWSGCHATKCSKWVYLLPSSIPSLPCVIRFLSPFLVLSFSLPSFASSKMSNFVSLQEVRTFHLSSGPWRDSSQSVSGSRLSHHISPSRDS